MAGRRNGETELERDCIDAEDGESLPKALDGGEFAVEIRLGIVLYRRRLAVAVNRD